LAVNVAVTLTLCPAVRLSRQFVPLQPPEKPEKVYPAAAVAVSVTFPLPKSALQVEGQLIPAGLLVTVPWPDMVTDNCPGAEIKAADTD
jgi:hypothetical protein